MTNLWKIGFRLVAPATLAWAVVFQVVGQEEQEEQGGITQNASLDPEVIGLVSDLVTSVENGRVWEVRRQLEATDTEGNYLLINGVDTAVDANTAIQALGAAAGAGAGVVMDFLVRYERNGQPVSVIREVLSDSHWVGQLLHALVESHRQGPLSVKGRKDRLDDNRAVLELGVADLTAALGGVIAVLRAVEEVGTLDLAVVVNQASGYNRTLLGTALGTSRGYNRLEDAALIQKFEFSALGLTSSISGRTSGVEPAEYLLFRNDAVSLRLDGIRGAVASVLLAAGAEPSRRDLTALEGMGLDHLVGRVDHLVKRVDHLRTKRNELRAERDELAARLAELEESAAEPTPTVRFFPNPVVGARRVLTVELPEGGTGNLTLNEGLNTGVSYTRLSLRVGEGRNEVSLDGLAAGTYVAILYWQIGGAIQLPESARIIVE